MTALSKRNDDPATASRPFDDTRDGFVLGEGAGVVVVESLAHARERGARPLAEVIGGALTADAFHISAPDPTGRGQSRAMTSALRNAGVAPDEIDYIVAHGTATQLNDVTETRAIKAAYGDHAYKVAISSPKSMIGHHRRLAHRRWHRAPALGAGGSPAHFGAEAAYATARKMVTAFWPPNPNPFTATVSTFAGRAVSGT